MSASNRQWSAINALAGATAAAETPDSDSVLDCMDTNNTGRIGADLFDCFSSLNRNLDCLLLC